MEGHCGLTAFQLCAACPAPLLSPPGPCLYGRSLVSKGKPYLFVIVHGVKRKALFFCLCKQSTFCCKANKLLFDPFVSKPSEC